MWFKGYEHLKKFLHFVQDEGEKEILYSYSPCFKSFQVDNSHLIVQSAATPMIRWPSSVQGDRVYIFNGLSEYSVYFMDSNKVEAIELSALDRVSTFFVLPKIKSPRRISDLLMRDPFDGSVAFQGNRGIL